MAALFIAFFVITFIIYLPALHSKFVFDFINIIFDTRKGPSLFDFSKGVPFDFMTLFVFKCWLKLFEYNAWAWHFLQCFLHAVNGILLYALLALILLQFQFHHWRQLSLVSTLCFLLNPYNTEPVVWGGALNYLLVGNFILLNLWAFARYLQTQRKIYLALASLALLAGAFSHELGWFILPADIILVFLFAPSFKSAFSKSNLTAGAVLITIMVIYFANKMRSGNMLGHYGSTVHLRFVPSEIIAAFFKYIFKISVLGNFLPTAFYNITYDYLNKPYVFTLLSIAAGLVFAILLFYSRKKNELKVPLALFTLFALFVFPVLNLYFPYWIKIHGDRYCYVTAALLVPSVISAFYIVRPMLAFVYGIVYLVASTVFLIYNIYSWHQAAVISGQLENEYRWQNAAHVYILNLPDNYRGAYMYRNKQPSQFAAAFIKYAGKNAPDGNKITEVLSYNLNSPADSVTIQVNGSNELKVTLSAWGTWWWRNTLGATSYQDERVNVSIDEWNHGYTVFFKQKQPGDVFIYCANGHWQQLQGF